MKNFIKTLIKNVFPKSVLRWRAREVITSRIDPDLHLLANMRKYLSELQGAEKFIDYFSKTRIGIDVGACGGEYSCVMATIFGRVLSIEPTFDMAAVLRNSLPNNCEVIECALGETPGEVPLRVPVISGRRLHALSTVSDHPFAFSNIGMVDITKVKQATLDKLVSDRNLRPSFIKIDVEGYEGEVLSGSMATIELCRPILMIEIEKRHNKKFREIFTSLNSYQYVPYHFRSEQLQLSGPNVVDESYEYLIGESVSGMAEVIASRGSGKYINNFLFLPRD